MRRRRTNHLAVCVLSLALAPMSGCIWFAVAGLGYEGIKTAGKNHDRAVARDAEDRARNDDGVRIVWDKE
ncbi:MAG: hypothetical protein H6819_02210 [Phycisphaerales bacterium]|nr:hypothetical protein [Phycisphaerales bacterium]MCB9856973.1 hypothetical protein [Phycisphaerales bacterium]MCB9861900.1 hypothetical protein [Phycisphaerales bacterium]